MDGRTDGMTNESPPVFYRTSSPLGPLPCFLSLHFTITQSRATGIVDHILPSGDLLYTFVKCFGAFIFETLFGAVEDSFVLARFADGQTSLNQLHGINDSLR